MNNINPNSTLFLPRLSEVIKFPTRFDFSLHLPPLELPTQTQTTTPISTTRFQPYKTYKGQKISSDVKVKLRNIIDNCKDDLKNLNQTDIARYLHTYIKVHSPDLDWLSVKKINNILEAGYKTHKSDDQPIANLIATGVPLYATTIKVVEGFSYDQLKSLKKAYKELHKKLSDDGIIYNENITISHLISEIYNDIKADKLGDFSNNLAYKEKLDLKKIEKQDLKKLRNHFVNHVNGKRDPERLQNWKNNPDSYKF